MKPVIAQTDYSKLKSVLVNLSPALRTKEMQLLLEELDRGKLVKDSEISADVIRLNSYFEAIDQASGQLMKFTLTLPEQANLKEGKISVISPLGIALIGFWEGMLVECELPAGKRKLKITKVVNE